MRTLAVVAVLVIVASGCLMRTPYFTDATATSERLNFATLDGSPAPVVTFGPSGSCSASSVTATLVSQIKVGNNTEYQWTAVLGGLSANTSYCYHVMQNGSDQLNGNAVPFTTPLAPGSTTPFSFAVIGDWGSGTQDETNVLARMRAANPSFVMSVGDNAYPDGTQTNYGDVGQGNVFPLKNWPAGQSTPFFAGIGHHGFDQSLPHFQNWPQDTVVAGSSGRYQQDDYCCTATMPGHNTYPSAWYAFDWGNARFYMLDAAWSDQTGGYDGDFQAHWNGPVPGCSVCGTQLNWLQTDLANPANAGKLKFASFFYPLHSDSATQPSDTNLSGPTHLEGVLATGGVKMVFNGHAHDYERNTPQIAGSPMVSYVTGGGGATVWSVPNCSTFDAYAIGWISSGSSCNAPTPTSASQVYHFLNVSVNGNSVTVTPTDENGNTFDVQRYDFTTTEQLVLPHDTNASIDNWLQPHVVETKTSPTFAPGTKLVVYLPGQREFATQAQQFLRTVAETGTPAIGLQVPNTFNVYDSCNADTTCEANTRQAIIYGGTSAVGTISAANSISGRLVSLLQYLDSNDHTAGWASFLTVDSTSGTTKPNWSSIVIAGHSQGGSNAAFVAKDQNVARAVLLAATNDTDSQGNLAPWITGTHTTPSANYYGFLHTADGGATTYKASWQALGIPGVLTSVDGATPPYGSSHRLTTSISASDPHGSIVNDGATPFDSSGNPVLGPAWRYLCCS